MRKVLSIILILLLVSGCQKKDDRTINATYRCKKNIYDEEMNAHIYAEFKYEAMYITKKGQKEKTFITSLYIYEFDTEEGALSYYNDRVKFKYDIFVIRNNTVTFANHYEGEASSGITAFHMRQDEKNGFDCVYEKIN